ncbi:ATP-binding cassette domain-containing protein [Dactylosporangium sp. NPDC000555]|uniref:ABC transporter ATP-binding protein n=1 Tax=Dactylosporangium sp. NPDC000555 TaxID=3154260 RepID=UPI003321AEBD
MSVLITGCSFQYRTSVAVFRDLNLEFRSGATVLLGPNGAGKSTLLSLIVGLLRPGSGTVRVGDLASHVRRTRHQYRRRVGWLPQNVTAMPGLKVREQVAYAGWLKGLSRRDAWDNAAGALRRVAMLDLADRPSRALSGGQLRRVGIAQALVHDARLVVMDEPSAGLDPQQRRGLRDVLNALAGDVDVLVSTHQTEDISDVYQNVAVLSLGVVRYHGSVPSFLALAEPGTEPSRRAEDAYIRLVGAAE